MKDDLDLTFGQIFADDPAAFLHQLQDIEVHHKADRQASEEWAKRLRFIDTSGVPDLERNNGVGAGHGKGRSKRSRRRSNPPCILPLQEKESDDGSVPYIAVSWRWPRGKDEIPWGYDIRESFHYTIQRPGHAAHDTDFPQHYLERVIRFAQSENIDKVWIDKECIYQREGDDAEYLGDKVLGVQAIDVFEDDVPIAEVQLLILRLLNDPRWSRGWIFQEDHLASRRMTLLVPHSKRLKKRNLPHGFGSLPGDLEISLVQFRKAVTMFCIALNEPENRWPINEMLGKAKQYNIWNKVPYVERGSSMEDSDSLQSGEDSDSDDAGRRTREARFPTMTLSILDDVCNRSLESADDRVAIVANAAKFERRIAVDPSSRLVNNSYSLSATLLALILLNGEMPSHRTWVSGSIMSYTLREYLRAVQNTYDAPVPSFEQSFINGCRFTAPSLINQGLEVKGHLYKILGTLTIARFDVGQYPDFALLLNDKGACKPEEGRTLSSLAEMAINPIILALCKSYGRRCWLVKVLQNHIEVDERPQPTKFAKPSERYILNMMVGLAHAVREGRNLWLARLVSESDTGPPTAIFVEPESPKTTYRAKKSRYGEVARPSFVFTSFTPGNKPGRHDCYASLNVKATPGDGSPNALLDSYGWINGVWNVEAEATTSFTYQIPGLTDWRMARTLRRKRKRKEDGEGGHELNYPR
ncbi:hypothetical protein NX059_009223 [Plenodomus lindquistii]|nr:hypothetical protein NX059_009223 [Plenodomus lindquistii]